MRPFPLSAASVRHQAGVTTVEFALLLPVLITLCAFLFQYGQMYRLQNALQKVAQSGARALSLVPAAQFGQQWSGIAAQMREDLQQQGLAVDTVQVLLDCLDSALDPFPSPPAYCGAGATQPPDITLGYVRATLVFPLAQQPWLPFTFPSGTGTSSGMPPALQAVAIFRYDPA